MCDKLMLAFFMYCACVSCTIGQSHSLTDNPGLKRFAQTQVLDQASEFDIKSVRIGDNVLAKSIDLQQQGGQVQYISGGSRSRKVKVSFFQAYQDSRLEQEVEMNFDKDKGFVTQVSAHYRLDSAYLDLQPVYQTVLKQAISKYAEPLSMDTLRQLTGIAAGPVPVSQFIQRLQTQAAVSEQVQAFFAAKIITPKARFSASDEGRAILISGFNQCYLWIRQNYTEILSLCAFRPNSGNVRGRGVELSLVNFAVQNAIKTHQMTEQDEVSISF